MTAPGVVVTREKRKKIYKINLNRRSRMRMIEFNPAIACQLHNSRQMKFNHRVHDIFQHTKTGTDFCCLGTKEVACLASSMASDNLVSKKSSYKLMNRNDKLEGVGTRMHHPSPYLHQVGKTD